MFATYATVLIQALIKCLPLCYRANSRNNEVFATHCHLCRSDRPNRESMKKRTLNRMID